MTVRRKSIVVVVLVSVETTWLASPPSCLMSKDCIALSSCCCSTP